jgi:hypothetical protein
MDTCRAGLVRVYPQPNDVPDNKFWCALNGAEAHEGNPETGEQMNRFLGKAILAFGAIALMGVIAQPLAGQ